MARVISLVLRYLKGCWTSFRGGSLRQASVALTECDLQGRFEWVAIGLNEPNKISGEPPKAKLRNFKPRAEAGRLELSTFCMDELTDAQRWALLDAHSDKPPIPARTEFTKTAILGQGLTADPDWDPIRHVNVIDWPEDETEVTSAAQALYASQLCAVR